jgi:large subunit ribosomal protein L31
MKAKIHPNYFQAKVICACGASWTVGSTRKEIRIDICSSCHPFYTGKEKSMDTAGRVEKFKRRYGITTSTKDAIDAIKDKK